MLQTWLAEHVTDGKIPKGQRPRYRFIILESRNEGERYTDFLLIKLSALTSQLGWTLGVALIAYAQIRFQWIPLHPVTTIIIAALVSGLAWVADILNYYFWRRE